MHFDYKGALIGAAVTALALGAAPALAFADRPASGNTELPADVMAALQRDLGLSAAEVNKQRAQQAKAITLDRKLQASLGDAFAGSSYDAKTGKLVVQVSDARKLDDAKQAGADARSAKHSKAELEAITASLDADAGKRGSATDRRANGARKAGVAGLTSWYIDTAANVVRVTVEQGKAKAAKAALAKHGDAVAVEESDLAPSTAANFMDGGDLVNSSSCSAGFNVRNGFGTGYMLTAGHCHSAGSTLRGQGGFGPVLESWFPSYDDAIARNDSAGYWIQGPWVDTNPSNGGIIITSGYTDAPVGTLLCKSGITTKWTCGYITAKNETVTYDGTSTVYGLTRHSACVEKGDSGGANVSVTSGYAAEGYSSGASMIWDGSRWRCRSVFGLPNISWHFPIADGLAYYGPKYGVATW